MFEVIIRARFKKYRKSFAHSFLRFHCFYCQIGISSGSFKQFALRKTSILQISEKTEKAVDIAPAHA